MTRRRPRPSATAPINVRLRLKGALVIVVGLALVTSATAGVALGLDVLLAGVGVSLIGAGIRRERAGLVCGGATVMAAGLLFTGATTTTEWEGVRLLQFDVQVVDAENGRPIGGATLAVVGRVDEDKLISDRARTDADGKCRLMAPVKIEMRAALYEILRDPHIELDFHQLHASPLFDQRLRRRSSDGWNVAAAADGYEPVSQRLADQLPDIASSFNGVPGALTIQLPPRADGSWP